MNHGKALSGIISGAVSGVLFAAAMLLSAETSRAQGTWEQITAANSILPSDSVRSLALDSAGNIWAATLSRTSEQGSFIDAGVYRFDGTGWQEELTSTTAVRGLVTAPNGILYAVVFPKGESPRLWQRKDEWNPVPSDQQSTTISETVVSRDGSLFGWESSPQPWVFLYAADQTTGEPGGTEYEQWLPSTGEGNYNLSTAAVDGNNAFWIVADQYEWIASEYRRKEAPSILLSLSLNSAGAGWQGVNLDRVVTDVAAGRSGVSGFTATDGFLVHSGTVAPQNWTLISGITSAQRVAQDMQGNFWIIGTAAQSGTEERLLYYDAAHDRLSNLAPLPYSAALIAAMVPDKEGNLWIAYNGEGLSLWHSGTTGISSEAPAQTDLAPSVIPNPARGASELRCTIPGPTRAVVEVFDRLGRHVETIYQGELEGGDKRFIWNGTEASGSYYYRISTRFGTATAKFIQIGE